MITSEQFQQLLDLMAPAQRVVVLVGKQLSDDTIIAASSLAMALRDSGKEVLFAGPSQLPTVPEYLEGLDGYTTSLGNRNLVVSFDYDESAVENVSYHIGEESKKFFLTIKPRAGSKPLDTSSVQFSYAGTEADLILMVGVSSFDALEDLYIANEQLFADTTIISLHTYETEIGQIKLDASGEPSLSNAAATIIRQLSLPMSAGTATNLLAGIEQTTSNFKSLSTTADTFELAAWLMRSGARRVWRDSGISTSTQAFAEVFSKQPKMNGKPVKKDKKPEKMEGEPSGGLQHQPSTIAKV
jgi:nanoRNase/pAp phosphatase (c-di-AMP/oligoRNAs hydrolase)